MNPRILLFALMIVWGAEARQKPAPVPSVPKPAAFRNQPAGAELPATTKWWAAFGDPLLDELMERAEKANLDVRRAASRLAEVQAQRGTAKSALLPTLDNSTSVNRLRGGFNQGVARITGQQSGGNFVSPFETGVLSSGFSLRWEADLFGGLRKSLQAATADAQAAAESQRDALLLVRGELARNYVELRGFEEQIGVVRADVQSQKDLLDLVRVRADAGLASELDVERQLTQVATTEAILPDLDTQRLAAIHRIGVLLGEDPGALRDRLEAAGASRLRTPDAPGAIPGEVLKRRPDVRKAEAEIAAAFARAGSARTEWYPKFVISGLSGRQSTDVGGLTLGAGNFFSVGPGISLPIFNAGRIRSKIAASDAVLEQALRSYEQEVLAAYEETENAYVARDRSAMKLRALESAQASARRSVELAQELYTRGLGDFLTVLDAQRQQLQIEREIAASRAAVLRNTVTLFTTLGE